MPAAPELDKWLVVGGMVAAMKVAVSGAKGKMGRCVVEFVEGQAELSLAGTAELGDDLGAVVRENAAQILVDFTRPEVRMQNVESALRNGAAAVVGTTGFTPEDLAQIESWVKETGRGCFIAPNFQIGNVLMQQFAAQAAKYLDCAEIIEYHHEQKVDYPSGTAVRTAELMAEARSSFNPDTKDAVANLEHARGAEFQGIRLHAVRMPGYVASQEVVLGASGQRLSIRHDSIDRASYMPGVLMAARHIVNRSELVYGLENIL